LNGARRKGYEEYHTKGSPVWWRDRRGCPEDVDQQALARCDLGTPDQCAERIAALRVVIDPTEIVVFPGLGSMTGAEAERSMRLHAEKVLPRFADQRERSEPVAAR